MNLTETDKISDLSYFQSLNLHTTWVLSHLNQLEFTFGGELIEHFYGNGRSQLAFEISPNSEVEFKCEIGNYRIRLFDRFSYEQNPTQDPTATNTANLNSLTNTIGAAVDADLNIAVLTLSGDYTYNSESGTTAQGQANASTTGTRETFRFGPTLTFQWSKSIVYGVVADETRSSSAGSANVNSLNFGPFVKGKLSRDFEFDLSGGASLVDTTPSVAPGYYFSAAARYQLNRHWQLLFSAAHQLVFTTGNDLTEENVFNLGTQFEFARGFTFGLGPFLNFGTIKTTTGGVGIAQSSGDYTQFGVEAKLVWTPRKRWSTSLSYDYVRRESPATFGTGTTASQNYIQNTIALSLAYSF